MPAFTKAMLDKLAGFDSGCNYSASRAPILCCSSKIVFELV